MKTICDWNNCFEIGEYKAPIEKDNSKNFRLLCLKHVKEFNKNWNYFSGMSDREVIQFLKSDATWHKPTQGFSSSDNFFKVLWNNALNDGFDDLKFKNQFNAKGNLNLKSVLVKTKSLGFSRIFLETGINLTASFLKDNLVNDLKIFISNKKLGNNGNLNIKKHLNLLLKNKKKNNRKSKFTW